MKAAKLFTLDKELIDKLKLEDNASMVVNSLLQKYFFHKDGFSSEELRQEIKEIELKIAENQGKLKKFKEILKKTEEKEEKLKKKCPNCLKENLIILKNKNYCSNCKAEYEKPRN